MAVVIGMRFMPRRLLPGRPIEIASFRTHMYYSPVIAGQELRMRIIPTILRNACMQSSLEHDLQLGKDANFIENRTIAMLGILPSIWEPPR